MTRRELRQGRALKYELDRRRFLHTMTARYRGDMRYCYARMMARKPEVTYHTNPLVYRQPLDAAYQATG